MADWLAWSDAPASKYQLTNYFMSLKPSRREIVHGPNQHGYLNKYINAIVKTIIRDFSKSIINK
jgi:hypothetical protein